MDTITLLVRFLIGLILGGAFVIWGGMPLLMGMLLAVGIGILVALWGDQFLAWLMRAFKLVVR
jgi:hypothetical protein